MARKHGVTRLASVHIVAAFATLVAIWLSAPVVNTVAAVVNGLVLVLWLTLLAHVWSSHPYR